MAVVTDLAAPADEIEGRPGTGAALRSSMGAAAQRRTRQRDLRPLARLGPVLKAHMGDATAAVLFLILSSGSTLSLTVGARAVVDAGLPTGKVLTNLSAAFALLTLFAVIQAIAAGSRFYFFTRLGERVAADLRQRLYRHILTLDPGYFLKVRTGEVLSRMTTDIAIIESVVGSAVSIGLRNSLLAAGAVTMLVAVSPRMTGIVLLLIPVVLIPLIAYGRRVRRLSVTAQDRFAEAVGYAGETLDALDTVQAFGRESSAADRFDAAVETAFTVSKARILARAILTACAMLLVFAAVAVILWWGVQSVKAGTLSAGALVQFMFLSFMAASSVGALGEVWGELQKGAGAMERIDELLGAVPQIAAPAYPTPLPVPARGEIAFRDVHFAYPGREGAPALKGLSFEIRAGERVALVGPSGVGKSTVLRLLLRFFDPQSGAVLIDGVDLRRVDPAQARARMALVAQDAALFSGSALDNIRFGRPDADLDAVIAAARAAQAEGFLMALPQGLDTPIGERARALSGGQRQRLAIARALARQSPILLLDEATSALDAENEGLVQKALDEAMEGRTTLVIAHRLATVLRADRILVMDEGRIVEEGAHADLVARGGLYARLAKLQFGAQL
ncbi:MAG TPA: ABC transporter transmembrane domain-containing protein [Caulobacteraceae bacterium]|nr:ABC transporter transmembrane domain-containing protein [Caulobacteraceae bacterium]